MALIGRTWLGLGLLITVGCFDPNAPADETSEGSGSSATDSPSSGNPTGVSASSSPATTDSPATTGATTNDPSISTTDPDTTAEPTDCSGDGVDEACPADAPFCQSGICVDCTGLSETTCAELNPPTPICDAATGTCTACTEHDQCESGACRIAIGECFDSTNRLWVDNTFAGCAGGAGTERSPLCSVVDAVAVINGQVNTDAWAIFVAGSPNPYEGVIDPDNNHPVAIIGPSAGLAALLANPDGYTVDLWAQSPETYFDHVTLDGGFNGTTIRCATGDVYLTDTNLRGNGDTPANITGCSMRMRRTNVEAYGTGAVVNNGGELIAQDSVFNNSSGGIAVLGGRVVLNRSVVSNNYVEGGITVIGGELTLINSLVFNNVYTNYGISIEAGGSAEVSHSMVIGIFDCTAPVGAITVHNSIVLDGPNSLSCPMALVDHSLVSSGADQGEGNLAAPPDLALESIFVKPVSFEDSDWHVLPDSLPAAVAVHRAGDPVIDFDGDPRPTEVGASDYAGADVP